MAFKMKGHTLPGPNQKESPAKFFITVPMLIAAGVSAAVGSGVSAITGSVKKKRQKRLASEKKASEGITTASEGITESVDKSGKTNLLAK